MTPDQSFARWVRLSLVAFVVAFVYFLAADLWMPLTPQSRVLHPVVGVAPRISGQVTEVHAQNNQHVDAGELLFVIDQRPFALAVEQAELALQDVRQQNAQLDAAIEAAEAQVVAARATAVELERESKRLETLRRSHSVSEQQYEQTHARLVSAKARLDSAAAEVAKLEVQRGRRDDSNVRESQARNALEQARLNLAYTEVRAESDGVISNLQVREGTYAKAGNGLAALVADEADIVADFREKSLSYLQPGDEASIVFDAYPGQVFKAHFVARDAGTQEGQLLADGRLAAPEVTDRWVRNAQRQRVHLELDGTNEPLALPTGARATVQLFPVQGLAQWLGALQIHAISLMHYIY